MKRIKYKNFVWEIKNTKGKRQQGLQHSHQISVIHTFVQSPLTQLNDIQDRDDMRAEESKQHLGLRGIWAQNAAASTREYEI
jgi:hypothetical protein